MKRNKKFWFRSNAWSSRMLLGSTPISWEGWFVSIIYLCLILNLFNWLPVVTQSTSFEYYLFLRLIGPTLLYALVIGWKTRIDS